jgi:hypothetical protein
MFLLLTPPHLLVPVEIRKVTPTAMKVNSYKVGDDASDGGTNCTSSNESASVDASDSSFPMPHLFKPSTRLSFKVNNILLSKGCAMIGPVVNLHLGSPERGDVL